ncbi:ATP-binding protein [Leeuwenhoekiella nanhaiensis]|uniref:histidine kinase n=1 Tax=Leeuwenhoekiella nanhaiensis TaxID=1655491 RepID=A0A2G1VSN2_9FLAO|nr:ATP-binding protein [Leeuwenhoekiella nanhaiensis]PHQ29787.1 hypothetical protein CJ305_07390 [Leeuwenhoekiella nanhaiensis]
MKPFYFFLLFLITSQILFSQRNPKLPQISQDSTKNEVEVYLDSLTVKLKREVYRGNISTAVFEAKSALPLAKKIKDIESQALLTYILSTSYLTLGDFKNARDWFEKIRSLQDKTGRIYVKLVAELNEANLALYGNNLEVAERHFDNARRLSANTDYLDLYSESLMHLAQLEVLRKRNPKGALIYLDSMHKFLEQTNTYYKAAYYGILGRVYDLQGRNKEAITAFEQSIAVALPHGYPGAIYMGYEGMIENFARQENYKSAYETFRELNQSSQTLNTQQSKEALSVLQARLRNTTAEQQIAAKDFQNKLMGQQAKVNRIYLIAFILASLILGTFLIIQSVSYRKRKKLVAELQERNTKYLEEKQKSEKLASAKTKFLSTVSHELRTPLYGIIGLTDALNRDKKLTGHKSELQSLKFSADYLLNLVNDVLVLNKMDSDSKLKIELTPIVIREFLEELTESLEFVIKQQRNELILNVDPKIPRIIFGDRTKLSQILINLVGNALKFTQRGQVHIRVKLVDSGRNTVTLAFEIEDDGIGIPKEKQQEIFEEFSQIQQESSFQGTGLGLTIVSRLLASMNSTIQLQSEVGEGSVFSFKIVFDATNPAKQGASGTKLASEDADAEILGEKHILIVDDNLINQLVTIKNVQNLGFTATTASSGLEAIDKVREEHFDLILMDINMPGMNGFEATREIRKFNQDIVILALTATEISEINRDLEANGLNGAILKPYPFNVFRTTLIDHLKSGVSKR